MIFDFSARRQSILIALLVIFCCHSAARAQNATVSAKLFDGSVAAGYVDKGAYINFTGPGVKWSRKPVSILIGVLPSLRFKKDNAAVKNSVITPSLGAGATVTFKKFIVQVPLYYQAKSATANGRWLPGLGIGLKL